MSGRRLSLLALAVFLVAAVAVMGWRSMGTDLQDLPTAVAERGPFSIVLTVSGELEAVDSTAVTAPGVGGNKKIVRLATEGARVEEGDEVVAFDVTDFEKEIRLAENDLEMAVTRLSQRQTQAERDRSQYDNEKARAHLSLERSRLSLTDSETVARIERDRARISVREAELTLEKLESDWTLKERDLKSELRLLALEKAKVEERLSQAKNALKSSVIYAPTSGLVIPAKVWKGSSWGVVEEGDSIWPGQSVLSIPDLSAIQVNVQIHEVDASQVVVGQAATFGLDAVPGVRFEGEVERIANLATTLRRNSQVKYFKTILKIPEADPAMKPGMTAMVDLQIETLDDVLSVPREALFDTDEGHQVYVLEGRTFVVRAVEVGKQNPTHAVIVSGLKQGEWVAMVDPFAEEGADGDGEGRGGE